ncbi:transporter substrate-binding domain-containing protein [Colwellia sp. D2M02]|nr:transporter substrate-binding domain-containing protein [Colwellia sp. D2M02]
MRLHLFILAISLLSSFSCLAGKKITIACGDALAPWVMPEKNNGIIFSLIQEALAPAGYELEMLYYPYARRIKSYQFEDVDAVCDINEKTLAIEKLEGFLSDEAYAYENFAYALKKNHFQFSHLNDLVSHSVMSWQGAVEHLGGAYAEMAKKNPLYRENNSQELQVELLFLERFEVIQIDQHIFDYYRLKVASESNIDTSKLVDKFPLFGKSPNGILFREEHIKDLFNKGLKALKQSGRYDKIFDLYSSNNFPDM